MKTPFADGMFILSACMAAMLLGCSDSKTESMKLSIWDRGIKVTSSADKDTFAYLWFYEWSLFDAVREGEHKSGVSDWVWTVDPEGKSAYTQSGWFTFKAEATLDGANLELQVTNNTERAWPDIAAIIPCFNPGFDGPKKTDAIPNPNFFDDDYQRTYFLGRNGLELLSGAYPREIHFNQRLLPSVQSWEKERDDEQFVWYHKWPTSERDAYEGLVVRESEDRTQTMAIAWDSFLTVQGHNPWKCMHLSVGLGPLMPGETKTIRGKIYLIEGSKEDCFARYKQDFPVVKTGR